MSEHPHLLCNLSKRDVKIFTLSACTVSNFV